MTGTDLAVIQTEIAEAQEAGDISRANSLYQAELATRAGQPAAESSDAPAPAAPAPASLPPNVTEAAWDAMFEADPEGARALKAKWGADAADNFAYVVQFARSLGLSDADLMELPDDVGLYELGARLGRQMVHAAPAPQQRQAQPETTDHEARPQSVNAEAFDRGMSDFSERIARAQSEGKHSLANQIYAEQQAWIARVKGNGPIVDGRKTA